MTDQLPISLQLERHIPPACVGCDKASTLCYDIAKRVIREQLDLDEAGPTLKLELQTKCGGAIVRPAGWGSLARSCRFSETES